MSVPSLKPISTNILMVASLVKAFTTSTFVLLPWMDENLVVVYDFGVSGAVLPSSSEKHICR